MKGPDDDFEDLDEMGSPQSSLQLPSSSSLESQQPDNSQRDEAEGMSAEAMAEDERDAENAVNLTEEAQVCLESIQFSSRLQLELALSQEESGVPNRTFLILFCGINVLLQLWWHAAGGGGTFFK